MTVVSSPWPARDEIQSEECVTRGHTEILYGICIQHDAPVFNEMELVGAVGDRTKSDAENA